MTSFRERRFQSRHDKPKGNLRYLVILIFLFALAIWILSVDLENASWLQWMTEKPESTLNRVLVDQKYFDGNATSGYAQALRHPIWVATTLDNSNQKINLLGDEKGYVLHRTTNIETTDTIIDKFRFCIRMDAIPVVQEVLDQSSVWSEEWGGLAMIGGILHDNTKSITEDRPYCPDSLFFAFMQVNQEPPRTVGFIIPNMWTDQNLVDLAVSVNSIEESTGIGLFNDVVSDNISSEIESERSVLTWGYRDEFYKKRLESRNKSDE